MAEESLSDVMAIKTYFRMSPTQALAEIKLLTAKEKQGLGALCRRALKK